MATTKGDSIGAMCIAIDAVFMMLWNRKAQAIALLFPSAAQPYRDQWGGRAPDLFWAKLDCNNRRRLVLIALAQYGEEVTP